MPELLKRSQLAEYLNITPVGTTQTWERIGFGVEDKSTDYEVEFDERQFIHQDSPDSAVKSYKMGSEFDMNAAKDSPLYDYLDTLRITRATYGAAESDYLEVRLYNPVSGQEDVFEATLTRVSVAFTSIGSSSEDPLTGTMSIKGKGDPVQGTFNYLTSTFTPAT